LRLDVIERGDANQHLEGSRTTAAFVGSVMSVEFNLPKKG
jgi:hypothetical protein